MLKNNNTTSLFILPFDHRGSFEQAFFGGKKILSKKDKQYISDLKYLIYISFLKSLSKQKNINEMAILIDDIYGKKIISDAKKRKIKFFLTTEMTGQKEFKFLHGNDFGKVINKYKPYGAKALIRYNPADAALNKRQFGKLKKLSDFCHKNNYLFLIEPLIIPNKFDLAKSGGTSESFGRKLRANYFIKLVKELRKNNIMPDIYKIEAFETVRDWQKVKKFVRQGKIYQDIKIILLGRGESKKIVDQWVRVGVKARGLNGFAIGRTIFNKPLLDFHNKKLNKQQTIQKIKDNFLSYIKMWKRLSENP